MIKRKMTKQALCVGINHFKNYPGAELRGCVNDAHDMRDYLQKMGYIVTVLTDEQATLANVSAWMVQNSKEVRAGQVSSLALSFSTHGTQVKGSQDERDGLDEAICLHDLAVKDGAVEGLLVDNSINAFLSAIPPGVHVNMWADTCYSGTIDREFKLGWKSRYLDLNTPAFAPNTLSQKIAPQRGREQIIWSACSDKQTAADAEFNGRPNGAFTYYFLAKAGDGWIANATLLKNVRKAMVENKVSQTPQLVQRRSAF